MNMLPLPRGPSFVIANDCKEGSLACSSSSLMPQELLGPSSSSDNDYYPAKSILDQLWAPTQSDLSRKRKIHTSFSSLVGKKCSVSQARKFDPHTAQPAQRASNNLIHDDSLVYDRVTWLFSSAIYTFLLRIIVWFWENNRQQSWEFRNRILGNLKSIMCLSLTTCKLY